MKFLSISEFQSLCNKLSPNEFILASDNQRTDVLEHGIGYSLVFTTAIIHTNPTSICFQTQNNSYIKLDRIKHIKKCEDSLLGKVFDIVCGGFIDSDKEYTYTFIVR